MNTNSLLSVHNSPNRRCSTTHQLKDEASSPRHAFVPPTSQLSRGSLTSRTSHSLVDAPAKKLTFGSYLDLKSPQFDLRHQAQQCLDVIHKLEESLKVAEKQFYDINETQDGRPSVGDCMNEVISLVTSTLALLELSDTSDISELLSKLNDKIFPAPSSARLKPDFSSIHTLIGKLVHALCQCVEESDYVEDFENEVPAPTPGRDSDYLYDYKQKNLERDQKNEELERKLASMDEGVEFCLSYLKTLVKYFKELRTYVQNRTKEEWNNFRRIQAIDHQHLSSLEALNKRIHPYFGTVSAQPIIREELDRLNERHAEEAIKNYFNLVSHKVLIPLNEHLKEHLEKRYNNFKAGWTIEKKKVQDAETAMNRAKERYFQAGGSYDFSMHRSEKKEDVKRKKELEEARFRLDECEKVYTSAIQTSNTCRKQHELFKGSIYCASRILATESDLKLAQSLEHFFRCQLEYSQPIPEYLSSVLEKVKKVEPGTSFSKVVSCAPSSQKKLPIESRFEKYSSSISVDPSTGRLVEGGVEGEDYKRRALAPSQSSPQASGGTPAIGEHIQRAAALKAQQTHDLSKLMRPTKCRVCDRFTLLTGVCCSKCDVAVHTKCLPFLIVICGQAEVNKSDNFTRCTTFGVSLEDQLIATKQKTPPIVTKCISEIEKRGLDLQGIYRIAGVKNKVETLCAAFESGNHKEIELSDEPPHLIASCLKLFFRQLPEPLFTFHLYDEFIPFSKKWELMLHNPDLEAAAEEKEKRLRELQEIIQTLPRPNFITARKLLRHLRVIHENASSNCMTAHNLGIVFGPTLFRPVELGMSALAEISHRTRLVEIMIDNPCTFEQDSVMDDDDDGAESPEHLIDECKSDSEILSPTSGNRRKSRFSLDGGVIRQPVSNIKRNRSIKDITRMTHLSQMTLRETSPFARRKRTRKHQLESKHESVKSPSLSPVASGDTKVPSLSTSRMRRKSSTTRSIESLSMISVDSMESGRERVPTFNDSWEFKKDSSNLTQDVAAVFQLNLEDYLRHTNNYAHTDDDISPSHHDKGPNSKSRLRKIESVAASYPNILDATTSERERGFVSRSYSSIEDPDIDNSSRYENRRHPGSLSQPRSTAKNLDDLDTRSDVTPINHSSSRDSSSLESASDDNTDADCDHEDRLFLINIKNEYDHYLKLPDQSAPPSQELALSSKELNECQLEINKISSQLDILITDCDKSGDGSNSSDSSSTNSSHYHTVEDHEHPSEEDGSPINRFKTKHNSPKKEYKDFNPLTS